MSSTESGVFRAVTPALAEATLDADLALVRRLIENEPAAWQEFGRAYERVIAAAIARVTRGFRDLRGDDTRDIRSALLCSLLANDRAKLRSFDPARGCRLASYIAMLATNAAYDHLRRLRRQAPLTTLDAALDVVEEDANPFEHAATREHHNLIAELLANLTEREREFASLFLIEGLTPSELATRLGISVGTVYSKKYKLAAKLEARVARDQAPDDAA